MVAMDQYPRTPQAIGPAWTTTSMMRTPAKFLVCPALSTSTQLQHHRHVANDQLETLNLLLHPETPKNPGVRTYFIRRQIQQQSICLPDTTKCPPFHLVVPSGGMPSSSGWTAGDTTAEAENPVDTKPTKNIFARWIERKTQESKNLGNV